MARRTDTPAGFLINLAVQGGDRMLAGVDAAAGQLILRHRLRLMGQQNGVAVAAGPHRPPAGGDSAARL